MVEATVVLRLTAVATEVDMATLAAPMDHHLGGR
jgi:hypothetical protein